MDRIVVELPGVEDPNKIKELLGKTAKMTFHLVDESWVQGAPAAPGEVILPMQENPGQKIAVYKHVEVDGADLTNAQPGSDTENGGWVVNFTFKQRRRAAFRRGVEGTMSASNSRVVLDNQVLTAPVIRQAITTGRGQISGGNFNAENTNQLSVLLRAGALAGAP